MPPIYGQRRFCKSLVIDLCRPLVLNTQCIRLLVYECATLFPFYSSAVPTGLGRNFLFPFPSNELLGYCRASLRDFRPLLAILVFPIVAAELIALDGILQSRNKFDAL